MLYLAVHLNYDLLLQTNVSLLSIAFQFNISTCFSTYINAIDLGSHSGYVSNQNSTV